jgi:hypothetical protein
MNNDTVSPGVKRPDREAGHSPQLDVEVNAGSSTSFSSVVIMAGTLIKGFCNRAEVARQGMSGVTSPGDIAQGPAKWTGKYISETKNMIADLNFC